MSEQIQNNSNVKNPAARRIFMGGGLVIIACAAAYFYLTGGRYIHTDNAYIKANIVSVSPEVSGRIVSVEVADNQSVAKGEKLFSIDREPFEIALQMAQANEDSTRTQIEELKAQYRQKQQDLQIAQSDIDLAQKNYDRASNLLSGGKGPISRSEMDQIAHDLTTAQQKQSSVNQEMAEIVASLNGNPDIAVEDHPKFKAAHAALDKAKLDLSRTDVFSPIDGTAGDAPDTGDYAHQQAPAISIVESSGLWVEANFKETDLTHMTPGQKAKIKVDTYPARTWTGTVESISPATSSEFSILPAQNATGNWVKVVQRIPVRIAIDAQQDHDNPPLRAGMSTITAVDTNVWPHMPRLLQNEAAKIAPDKFALKNGKSE